MIRASAPGKLMLAGEYVVIERGVPALAVAVDRRLSVEVVPEAGRRQWLVTSPALALKDAQLKAVPVLAEVVARVPGLPSGGRITVSSQLGEGADKPGLGSSAALCAAALAAFWRLSGASGPPDVHLAIAAHRASQGGRGSGYDVAASVHGGVTLFHPAQGSALPVIERLPWPAGLHAAVFRAGKGSSTVEFLGRMSSWRDEDPESFDACIEPLAAETLGLIGAFREGNVPQILDGLAQVQEELQTMDRIGELGILAGGQCQLLGLIEDAGAIGRTSGAGGGDCAWALTDDPGRLAAVAASAAELGFSRLEVELGGAGLRVGDDA